MEKNTAVLIVIGDEILRGQVEDKNTSYLASKLYAIGIKFHKVIIVPDSIFDIAKELSEVSKNYPIVFTSGGVGPTHDDLTYEAVGKCFKLEIEENKELLDIYKKLLPNEPEVKRYAMAPSSSEVIYIKSQKFAVIKVNNVYVLPGSPKYFQPAVDKIISTLKGGVPLFIDELDIALKEVKIVKGLDAFAERWKGRVSVGSYPQQFGTKHSTRITFEGKKEDVIVAKKEFQNSFSESRFNDRKFSRSIAEKVLEKIQAHHHLKRSWSIIEECFDRFSPNEVFLSFNGGKDCTAVLHLTSAFLALKGSEPLLSLYIIGDSFPEVEEFVAKAAAYYGLRVVRKNRPMKEALTKFIKENPKLRACLMGTRKADPNAENLEPFCQTDPGWPELLRVNPIFDWNYNQIWQFLLDFNVPYCSLYDKGYSSVGVASLTLRNPLLRDPNNPSIYLPAHTLADDSTERQGRE